MKAEVEEWRRKWREWKGGSGRGVEVEGWKGWKVGMAEAEVEVRKWKGGSGSEGARVEGWERK